MQAPYWAEIRDISAYVSPMNSYRFTNKTPAETTVINGYFVDIYGVAVGSGSNYSFTYTLTDSVVSWQTIWSASFGGTMPDSVVGVRFDHDKNLSYVTVPASASPSLAQVRSGPTWEAARNRAVGRNG